LDCPIISFIIFSIHSKNLIKNLFLIAPTAIAISGQRSLTSKIKGFFFILDNINPNTPTVKGVLVA
jgi:hypothetical protein